MTGRLTACAGAILLFLSANGATDCGALAVLVAPTAPKAERIAADELAGYVGRITGVRPPVVTERPRTGAFIAVGLPEPDMTFDPAFDSYRIRSVPGGLVLAGGNGRSTLYAVYDFLERRGGCRWFWDCDVVPEKGALDLTGLDVYEVSKFEYRGIRYFAHRGLTRFQAEHWGFDDWKREIDWCLKRRLNLYMLRIGTDDLFQRAYPDVVPYPDPAKRLPEALAGHDDRSLFWPLEYRAKLRKRITDYARERGLLQPVDFGTMSHWYSRTPYAFLDKVRPDFLPQQGGYYGHPTDRVWDIRQEKWLEAYWKLTDAYLRDYGDDGLLHTIGLGERMCYTNRADNLRMKIDMIHRLDDLAKRKCPRDRVLLAGWDFWCTWKSPEVRELVKTLDPSRVIIWDYEADQTKPGNGDFSEWGVCRTFPYAFGIFLAYESGLDIRADYATIERRQRLIEGDPMCKAYLLWPESSHTDTFALRYFTANAWRAECGDHRKLLPDFCRDRYGDEDAASFESVWRRVLPVAATGGWGNSYANRREYWEAGAVVADDMINRPDLWTGVHLADLKALSAVPSVLRDLARIPLRSEAARRDAVDLARTAVDRLITLTRRDFSRRWCDYLKGATETARLTDEIRAYAALGAGMARLLALHTDYSLWDSLQRLRAIEPVRYPDFEHTLAENAGNDYCRSHHAEFAQHWYAPCMKDLSDALLAKVAANDRTPLDVKPLADRSQALRQMCFRAKLQDLAPRLPRTDENLCAVLGELATAADLALGCEKEKTR